MLQKYFKTIYQPVQTLPDGSIACTPQRRFYWRKLARDCWGWIKEQDSVIWDWLDRHCNTPYEFYSALQASLQFGSPLV